MRHLIADFDAGPKSAWEKCGADEYHLRPISSKPVSGQLPGCRPSTHWFHLDKLSRFHS
jgi:hypothetical protein